MKKDIVGEQLSRTPSAIVREAAKRHAETGCTCGSCWQCRAAGAMARHSTYPFDQNTETSAVLPPAAERCPICYSRGEHSRFCTRGDTPHSADAMAYKLELALALQVDGESAGPALIALAKLLDAVKAGATLVLTGPDPLGPKGCPLFGASIESTSGRRHADAYGDTPAGVFNQLLEQWNFATEEPQ